MIKSMNGCIQRNRGIGCDGFELIVTVSFDSVEFKALQKKKISPLEHTMAQIKNVVFDSCGVRGIPGYSPAGYKQYYPRAKKGVVTLKLYFEVDIFVLNRLKVDTKEWCLYHEVELQKTLESTRGDGHLFAKTALDSLR